MDIALSGSEVMLGMTILIAIIVGLILAMRMVYQSRKDLVQKNRVENSTSKFKNRTKYPEVNILRQRGILFRVGLASSLAFSILAISWTSYTELLEYPEYILNDEPFIEVEPPRTDIAKPIPPPPSTVIEEVPIEEIIEEQPDFEPVDVESEFVFEEVVESKHIQELEAPKLPDPVDDDIIEIFKVVEEMPLFPGCHQVDVSQQERKICSDQKLLQYLYKNLKYPSIARENGVEGRVYIQFVVERDGSVSDSKIVRDIGAGCGNAALDVVEKMNNLPSKWTPGKQRGSSVRVLYTLPVTFRLER